MQFNYVSVQFIRIPSICPFGECSVVIKLFLDFWFKKKGALVATVGLGDYSKPGLLF